MKAPFLRMLIVAMLMLSGTASKAQYTINSLNIFDFDSSCVGSVDFNVTTSGYTSGLSIQCYFGDGANGTYIVTTGSIASFPHVYPTSGRYSFKLFLYLGGVAIDSMIGAFYNRSCSYFPIITYVDHNSNCVYDTAIDTRLIVPAQIAVDSAGVRIDTILTSCFHGYLAAGPPGTIFTFTIISCPSGLSLTCPSTGIVYDTVPPAGYIVATKLFAFECNTSTVFDLGLNVSGNINFLGAGGIRGSRSFCYITNTSCTPMATTLTVNHSPKISVHHITPSLPYTISGNTITINTGLISVLTPISVKIFWDTVGTPVLGDTVNTTFTITPTSGDSNIINNIAVRCDTVRMAHDPNYKSVMPSGDITAGTLLEYMVQFENTGNDTAINIHILDTLSNNVDANTLNILTSSHAVTMIPYSSGGYNIVKFDFPNINLPDSSHPDLCHGFVTYTVRAKSTMTPGMAVHNAAGIYFDINPVVMTNTTESKIPGTLSIAPTSHTRMELYPNPVKDVLNIKAEGTDNTMSITNALGQLVMTQHLNSYNNTVNVRSLAPGLYYMTIKGAGGTKVQKFEKM